MPPKGKGKKGKHCLRCPSDIDEAVKCSSTIKCKSSTGDYAELGNLWPGFPSDATSSFAGRDREQCERLLETAETKKEYLWDPITKQILELALKVVQDKGKSTKPPMPVATSSKATAKASELGHEQYSVPSEGPKLSSLQELAHRERIDPFAKLMHNSKLGRSVTTPLKRPQMRLELDMPRREGLSSSSGPNIRPGNPIDCRAAWTKQLPQIEKQRNSLEDRTDIYASRPGFTNNDQGVFVRSNHFVVDLDAKKELYEFEILGIPDSASRARKRDLVETMMLNCPALRDQSDEYATDFKKKIIAWKNLFIHHAKEDPEETRTIKIPGRSNPQGKSDDTTLRLNFVRKLSVRDLNDYVQGRQITFANTGLIEALNILISKGVSEADAQSIEVGNNRFYYKPGHSPLADGLIAIRGYFASIRPGMGHVLLNVNTVMGAFYEPVRVDWLLKRLNDRHRAEHFLKGVRVRIMYDRAESSDGKGEMVADPKARPTIEDESIDSERRRTKSIWGLGLAATQQTFDKDKKRIGVLTYMRETYPGVRINDSNLPCINLGNNSRPSWFLAEHLQILPYQLYKSKLDPFQVAEMIKHACRDPDTNRRLIMEEGLPSIGIIATLPRVLAQMNMRINRNMIEVPGFSIPMPNLECQRRNPPPQRSGPHAPPVPPHCIEVSKGSAFGYHWEMARAKPIMLANQYRSRTHLIYVSLNGRRTELQSIDQILSEFNHEIVKYGFGHLQLTQANCTMLPTSATPPGIKAGLDAALASRADLVVLILPSSGSTDASAYRYFKSRADQVYGFKTLCMAEDKILKGGLLRAIRAAGRHERPPESLRNYMSGVAMKLNLKLGNWNWDVARNELRDYLTFATGAKLDTLVLGADVTHPSASSSEGTPSIAAIVGNVDWRCGRMPGSMRCQASRAEMIEQLDEMVEERLRDWNATNRTARRMHDFEIPSRIIYYRDGVSRSQYSTVKITEIPQIRAAWARARTRAQAVNSGLYIPSDVHITVVLVSKRHNTRFYPSPANHPLRDTDGNKHKGKGNLRPGVMIESVVTSPYWHDFYLNSHFGLQGTVRPCHYIVLHDENALAALRLQKLTFLLCHMYQRAMCAVSYVAPTYYADRLCERGRHYLADFFDGVADVKGKSPEVVKEMVEQAWFRGDGSRQRSNPWHRNLDGTMFWL